MKKLILTISIIFMTFNFYSCDQTFADDGNKARVQAVKENIVKQKRLTVQGQIALSIQNSIETWNIEKMEHIPDSFRDKYSLKKEGVEIILSKNSDYNNYSHLDIEIESPEKYRILTFTEAQKTMIEVEFQKLMKKRNILKNDNLLLNQKKIKYDNLGL